MSEIVTSLIPLDALEKINEALDFAKSIQVVKITNNAQYQESTKLFRELGGYIKAIDAERVRVKAPYLEQGREVDQYFADPSKVLAGLKAKLDPAIREYDREVERKRIEEQNRLNAIAEENRRKAEAAAQAERDKAEAKRREAEQEQNAARKAELERQAAAAEVRAEAKEQKAETIVAPIAQMAVPKVEGVSKRKNWQCQIDDPFEFVKWAIENNMHSLLMPNQSACNNQAKVVQKEVTYKWGKFWNNESLTGRAI